MTQFDKIYWKLLSRVFNEGIEEFNERTEKKTLTVTGAHFDLDLEKEFPLLTLRKIPLKLFIAEQIWYLQGDQELDFFQKFSKIWDDFKDDPKINKVSTSYGYRWTNFFKRNQIDSLLKMFEKDPSSRHGVIVTWDPNTDGLNGKKKKNVPCVPVWTANIVGEKLYFHIIFRSNDIMLGLPHDVAGFALLQEILAQQLGIKVGKLHYSISNLHIYDNHYRHGAKLLTRVNDHRHKPVKLELPSNSYTRSLEKDETLVKEIYKNLMDQYNPQPSLGKMQIAL